MALQSIFPPLMIATFVAALVTLAVGIAGMTGTGNTQGTGNRSTLLMALRVGLCTLLLLEIILYITFVRP